MDTNGADSGQLIKTSRGDFYVERTGPKGEPSIVFVSAFGDDHTAWAEVTQSLALTYDCIAFDNRGIGQSPITAGPYTIAQMAEDLHEIVCALGTDPVLAVGASMGGAVCQEWALAHPESVTHLVLTNTWAEQDAWLSSLFDHWIDLAEADHSRELLHSMALFCFSPGFLSTHRETVPEFLSLPVPDLGGLVAAARAVQGHQALDRLGGVSVPTLVIGAEYDIITRSELSAHIADALPQGELRWLPTGHMSFWEQPDAWTGLVRDFLDTTAVDRSPR